MAKICEFQSSAYDSGNTVQLFTTGDDNNIFDNVTGERNLTITGQGQVHHIYNTALLLLDSVLYVSIVCYPPDNPNVALIQRPNYQWLATWNMISYGTAYSPEVGYDNDRQIFYSLKFGYIINLVSYNVPIFYDVESYRNYIMNVAPPPYTWTSVRSLSMAERLEWENDDNSFWSGGSTMLLSSIDDEELVDLDTATPTPVDNLYQGFSIKSPSLSEPFSSFSTKWLRLANGNYATIKMEANGLIGTKFTLTFFLVGNSTTIIGQYIFTLGAGDGNPYLGFIIDNEEDVARLNIIFLKESYDSSTGLSARYVKFNTVPMTQAQISDMYAWLTGSWGEDDNPEEGEENNDQGNDDYDPVINNPLDSITNPTYGALSSGFVKLYKISPSQLANLADYMWSASFIENLVRLFSDPRELIVGLSVFPLSPTSLTSDVTIRAGNLSTGVVADLLNSEYMTRFGGEVKVPKGKSNFMSFGPYRRIKVSIPYCGEHELDPSAVYGRKLSLYYHLSFFSGTCVAELKRDGEAFMFFGGQIGFQIPISSVDYTRTISSLLSAGIGIGTSIMTGGGSLLFGGATEGLTGKDLEKAENKLESQRNKTINGVAGALNSLTRGFSPNVSYNSAGGSTSGFLGCQQPFLVIEESISAYDSEQNDFLGVVKKKVMKLDDCDGFTKVTEVHLEGIGCTDKEQDEINAQLKAGVIIRSDGSLTPSATTSQLVLLKNLSENNVIGKTWDVTMSTINWENLHDQSIMNPDILIDGDCTGYNYVYIPLFNRFYFISDYKWTRQDLQRLSLKVDVLQSFADDILDCDAIIDRGTGSNNAFIEDPYKWTQANKEVSTVPFTNAGFPVNFDHQEDCYILAIASGNN